MDELGGTITQQIYCGGMLRNIHEGAFNKHVNLNSTARPSKPSSIPSEETKPPSFIAN